MELSEVDVGLVREEFAAGAKLFADAVEARGELVAGRGDEVAGLEDLLRLAFIMGAVRGSDRAPVVVGLLPDRNPWIADAVERCIGPEGGRVSWAAVALACGEVEDVSDGVGVGQAKMRVMQRHRRKFEGGKGRRRG